MPVLLLVVVVVVVVVVILLMSVHSDECYGLKPHNIVNYVD